MSESGAERKDETTEDKINRIIESRKLLINASYFALTTTPKNTTLEIFGIPYQVEDEVKHRPFHADTMKQAIQEGLIRDVLKHYTPVASYCRLAKTIEGDPESGVKTVQTVSGQRILPPLVDGYDLRADLRRQCRCLASTGHHVSGAVSIVRKMP